MSKRLNKFGIREGRKYCVPRAKHTPEMTAEMDDHRRIAQACYGVREHGGWISECAYLDPYSTMEKILARARLYSVDPCPGKGTGKGKGTGSHIADATHSLAASCHNCGNCPVHADEKCMSSGLDIGRGACLGRSGTPMTDAIARFRSTGLPQLVSDNILVSFRANIRYFMTYASELWAPSVPECYRIAALGMAIMNPQATFVFCTRRAWELVRFLNEGRFNAMFAAGKITNVVLMFSISTQAEADMWDAALRTLRPELKLKLQLSARPLLEDNIRISDFILNSPWIPQMAGDTSGMLDWHGRLDKKAGSPYTQRAEQLIKDVFKRSGKRLILDNPGSALPVKRMRRPDGSVFLAEKCVTRRNINPKSKAVLVLKHGEVLKPKFRGQELTAADVVILGSDMYLPVSRNVTGKFSEISDEIPEFTQAQLQAPVSG